LGWGAVRIEGTGIPLLCKVDPQEEVPEAGAEGHLDDAMKG